MASRSCDSVLQMSFFSIFVVSLLLFFPGIRSGDAYTSHNQRGNITIKWDIIQWTPDGYVAVVNIYNFQHFSPIQAPGWTLGWIWSTKEIIWSMFGAKTKSQGDCSRYVGNIPTCCKKSPSVVDLPRGSPYNMQVENCCRGGVLSSWDQDRTNALSAFQLSVGAAGTTNRTVNVPKNFTFRAPGPKYTCSRAIIVRPTIFLTPDRKRLTQAIMTWRLACTHYQQ